MLRRLGATGLCCALALMGCPGGEEPRDAGDDVFTHQAMAVHCWNSLPLRDVTRTAEAPDELVGSAWAALDNNQTGAQATVVSHDRGRTFAHVPTTTTRFTPPVTSSLFTGPPPYFAGPDFWATHAQVYGSSAGSELDANGVPLWLTVVLNGVATELRAQEVNQTLAGRKVSHLWKASAQDWFVRGSDRMYVTRDGGQTLTLVAPARQTVSGNVALIGRLLHGDAVLYETAGTPGDWYRRDGEGPLRALTQGVDYPKLNTPGQGTKHYSGAFANWGSKLVYTDRVRVWASADDGATWTQLETAEATGPASLELIEDPQGRLWGYPGFGGVGPEPRTFLVYRWEPGQTKPTLIDLDFGALPVDAMVTPSFDAQGNLLFSSYRGRHRDFRTYALCEAGPAVTTTQLEPVVVEPWQAAVESDRVVLVARFLDGSDVAGRVAVSPARKVYAETIGAVLAAPFDADPVYAAPPLSQFTNGHPDAGLSPMALWGATETSVTAALFSRTELTLQPPTMAVTFDARTGAELARHDVGKAEELLEVFSAGGVSFDRARSGTYFTGLRTPAADDPNALRFPKFPVSMVMDGAHGALVSDLNGFYADSQTRPSYVLRFDPTSGRVPDDSQCRADGGAPVGCLAAPDMGPLAARFDPAGNLYVLDARAGRVLMLPAGASTLADWKVLATGFMSPTDLQLRGAGGKTLVLVFDGDVFAFSVDPTKTKVRGATAPTTGRTKVDFRARDRADCLSDGPCLDVPDVAPVFEGAQVCLTGKRLGTSGHAFLGAVEATVASWADDRVCLSAASVEADEQLQLVRADGLGSNLISFEVPSTVSSVDIPSPLTTADLIHVKGTNLAGATVSGVLVIAQSDGELVLRASSAGAQTLTVSKHATALVSRQLDARPSVVGACRAAADQPCSVTGVGLGEPNPLSTVTVEGQPAEVLSWSQLEVRLRVPAGLSVGPHAATFRHADGTTFSAQVEVLPRAIRTLVQGNPSPDALRWVDPRPVQTSYGLVASMSEWLRNNGAPAEFHEVLVDVDFGDRTADGGQVSRGDVGVFGGPFVEKPTPTLVAESAGAVYTAGIAFDRNDEVVVSRITPPPVGAQLPQWTGTAVTRVRVEAPMQVSAFGDVQGHLVLAVATPTRTKVFELSPGADGGVTTSSLAELPASPGFPMGGGSRPSAIGTTLTASGVYLSSCHNDTRPSELHFAPWAVDGGALSVGAMEDLITIGGTKLTACSATDAGLIYVQRGASAEVVFAHDPVNGYQPLGSLSAAVPGFLQQATQDPEFVPGIVDVARLPDGDVLLLTNELETPPLGLRLVRLHGSAVTTGAVVAPSTRPESGEVCLGPVTNDLQCPLRGAYGCAPLTCPLSPLVQVERASNRIGKAWMLVDGARVRVVYQVTDIRKLQTALYEGTDVNMVDVQVP